MRVTWKIRKLKTIEGQGTKKAGSEKAGTTFGHNAVVHPGLNLRTFGTKLARHCIRTHGIGGTRSKSLALAGSNRTVEARLETQGRATFIQMARNHPLDPKSP